MAIPPDIRIRLEQLRGEMAAKAEAQRRQQQAQDNAEKMSKQFVPGKAKGGLLGFLKDSKIKQVMFHGTNQDIRSFKPGTAKAVFVAHNPDEAHHFAHVKARETDGQGKNIMPVYVKVKNPFDYENPEHMKALREYEKANRYTDRSITNSIGSIGVGNWEEIERKPVQDAIKSLGHDSFYVKEGIAKNLGVYDVRKIKSATGNRGTYDTSDPDITKAGGGRVLPKDQHDENLKRFLAESAIKQRMYTGTSKDKDFSKFNVPRNGAWFTPSTEVASAYAKENDSKDLKYDFDTRRYKEVNTADRVMPVYLRATKPYQITADDIKSMRADNYKKAQSQFFDKLRAKGHDSVVYEDGTTVILEGPHQIKSAIGNRGTYDPSNPDITKADGGEVKTPSLDTMKLALTQKGGVLPKEEHDENLRKFLDRSQIKDRLYHATPENFSEFKPGGKDPTLSGPAIWLSPDPHQQPAAHNVWGGSRGFKEGTNVMPVHVQAKRPLVLDDPTMMEWAREVFANGSREFPDLLAPQTVEEIKKEGYDSIIHADPYNTGRLHEVIMFEPNKIKSATANRGTFDTSTPDITKAEGGKVQPSVAQMKLALNKQGMYSPLEKAAMSIPRTKGTPAEFMAEISKQPGFRKDEVEDRKISLPEQKMTKQEFLEHIQKNHPAPKIEEKVFGGEDYQEALDQMARSILNDRYASFDDLDYRDQEMVKYDVGRDFGYNPETHHEEWALPGGDNYREVLLKKPEFKKDHLIMQLEADMRRSSPSDQARLMQEIMRLKAEKEAMGEKFSGVAAHYKGEPNILASLRLSDRVGPNGEKILHVDEIQSDWHQKGRKEGYREGKEPFDPMKAQRLKDKIFERFDAGEIDRQQRNALLDQLGEWQENGRRVPDAPFKKNWHELALKHALSMAAKGGYHGIAITPGEQQADRYDLSNHIDEITYGKNSDGTYDIGAKKDGSEVFSKGELSPDELASHVGKEMAEKIVANHGNDVKGPWGSYKSLSGLDLKVGGEGMKGFYDKIIPTYLNKLGKPHGAQVGTIPVKAPNTEKWGLEDVAKFHGMTGAEYLDLDHPTRSQLEKQFLQDRKNQTTDLHYFPITDSLRQQVKTEGLPQYEHGGKVAGIDHFFQE